MASKYEFAILEKRNGAVVVKAEPRDTDDIVEHLANRIKAKIVDKFVEDLASRGVGWFRSTPHVKDDARAAITQALNNDVTQAIEEVIFELKTKVTP